MLTKRVHVLFDEALWKKLSKLAKARNISIGSVIRNAVDELYISGEEFTQRRKTFKNILKHRPAPVKGRIDYKALINAGRKY